MTQSIIITSVFPRVRGHVKMAYSTSEDMSGALFTAEQTVSANQITKHTITGLADATEYWYQPASVDGHLFGKKGRFETLATSGACSVSIIHTSCQTNYHAASADLSQPVWRKVAELGPHNLVLHQGDFGYPGGKFSGTESTGTHIRVYTSVISGFTLMRDAIMGGSTSLQPSDHEYSNDNGDSNASGKFGAQVRKMIDADVELFPVDPADYGDSRTPILGQWRSFKIMPNVKVIVIDFRSLERSLQSMNDGASKTALGAAQLAWLFDELTADDSVLKILSCDNAWGPAASFSELGVAGHQDKWWGYQYEQKVIADFVNNNTTLLGDPIYVEYLGGDRHVVGWLAEENNILADGTHCPWDVITASSSDKDGLFGVKGELYDEVYGFTDLPDDITEPRQFGHLTYSDDGAGTITRVFDGWNCAPDPYKLYVPQSYAPVKVIDGKTKTWNYGSGGGEVPEWVRIEG